MPKLLPSLFPEDVISMLVCDQTLDTLTTRVKKNYRDLLISCVNVSIPMISSCMIFQQCLQPTNVTSRTDVRSRKGPNLVEEKRNLTFLE